MQKFYIDWDDGSFMSVSEYEQAKNDYILEEVKAGTPQDEAEDDWYGLNIEYFSFDDNEQYYVSWANHEILTLDEISDRSYEYLDFEDWINDSFTAFEIWQRFTHDTDESICDAYSDDAIDSYMEFYGIEEIIIPD